MTSTIHKVALCTATGKIGPIFLQTLLAEGLDVTVIVRASSNGSFPPEQKVRKVSDEYTEDELVSAFQGQDAVVLSLGFELLPVATKFARASLTAGCQWLIASTYGANLDDPKHALFPASVPHRQAVDDLMKLQQGQEKWSWTSISCGPWPELAIAAGAWNINPQTKTAHLVDGGHKIFSSTTRAQLALTVARILKRQPLLARNKIAYVASVEASMAQWLDAHKQVLGSDGWKVTSVSGDTYLKESQEKFAAGDHLGGYIGTSLVVCSGEGYQNRFSEVGTLLNKELGLPEDNMVEVVKEGLATKNPFA